MFYELQWVKSGFCVGYTKHFLEKAEQITISCHGVKRMKVKVHGTRYGFILSDKLHNPSNFQFIKRMKWNEFLKQNDFTLMEL